MLMLKEMKKTMRSITYVLFVVMLCLFAYAQIGLNFEKIEAPEPGLGGYGIKYENEPERIMPNAIESLQSEFNGNSYVAYPFGIYKVMKLSDLKQAEMAEMLTELLTGTVTAERFQVLMDQADQLIGGGSKYSQTYITNFGVVYKTYEEALAEYEDMVEKDRISGALARLFCDYLGVVLSIVPVFVAVAFGLRDRRARCQPLIFTRGSSSYTLMLTRYAAMVAAMLIPVLLMALYATVRTSLDYSGFAVDQAVEVADDRSERVPDKTLGGYS